MKTKRPSKKVVSKISQMPHDKSKAMHKCNVLIEGVPRTTKTKFKAKCAERETTMRDAVIIFMREFITEG